jgi:hypothetical protein
MCVYIIVQTANTCCVRACARTHTNTPFHLGHKHECAAHAICYTYQTLTAKPVFMAENTVSLMELIAAGHSVVLPHDAGNGQALCGMEKESRVSDRGRQWKQDQP